MNGFPSALAPWTYADLKQSRELDPINVLIVNVDAPDTLAVLTTVGLHEVNVLERLTARQFFRDAPQPPHEADLSAGSGRDWLRFGRRTHARIFHPADDADLGAYSACTAHTDQIPWKQWLCLGKEVAASFGGAREDLMRQLQATGQRVRELETTTVGSIRQCDGRRTAVDGKVLVFNNYQGAVNHLHFQITNSSGTSIPTRMAGKRYGDVGGTNQWHGQPIRNNVLWTGPNLNGDTYTVLATNDPDLRNDAVGNDNVSSLQVNPGCTIVLYREINYGGDSRSYSSTAMTLGDFSTTRRLLSRSTADRVWYRFADSRRHNRPYARARASRRSTSHDRRPPQGVKGFEPLPR